jgi:hypothetical protein
MRTFMVFALAAIVYGHATSVTAEPRCRMEKQCRWVNFKKVCTYVKVCR